MNRQSKLYSLGFFSYADYLQSSHWKTIKAKFFASHPKRCSACRTATQPLHLHHLTYERLGCEQPTDLCCLCEEHHAEVHILAESMNGAITLSEATQQIIKESTTGEGKAAERRLARNYRKTQEVMVPRPERQKQLHQAQLLDEYHNKPSRLIKAK